MVENKTFFNNSVFYIYSCSPSEKTSIDFRDWLLHFGATIVYFMTAFIVYIVVTFVRKISFSPENILFMAVLSSGWLSIIFWYIPPHIIRITEYNKEPSFIHCHGLTYNEKSEYPACRINFMSHFIAIQFLSDVSIFSLTFLALLKFAAVQFPIWSKCHVTTKHSYRGICVALILSVILNVPDILLRNFPSSNDNTVCLDIIEEHISALQKATAYCWFVVYSLCLFIFVGSAVFITRGLVKHRNNGTRHYKCTQTNKRTASIVKNIAIVLVFIPTESFLFVSKCDIKLNMIRIDYFTQYFELTWLFGFTICICLYIYISGNFRMVLFKNKCRCCNIGLTPNNRHDTTMNNSATTICRGITYE